METSLREPRPGKVAVVDEVQARLTAASAAILTEYRGIAVKDLQQLRRLLTAAGGDYKVYKNTLVRRAVQQAGLDVLEPLLTGPTAIAFVRDDVAAVAKVLRDFARTNPSFVVKGGLVGSDLLDARRAAALADLPSKEVLLAQLAGLFAAPLQRLAGLLQAVPQKFAYAVKALIDERGGVPEVASDVEGGTAWEAVGASEEDAAAAAPGTESVEGAAPEAPETAEPETVAPEAAGPEAAGPDTAEPEATVAEAEQGEATTAEASTTEVANASEADADTPELEAASDPEPQDGTAVDGESAEADAAEND